MFIFLVAIGCSDTFTEPEPSQKELLGLEKTIEKEKAGSFLQKEKPVEQITFQVYFTNIKNMKEGIKPYVKGVYRKGEKGNLPQQALNSLYRGPLQEEKGLTLTRCESTGAILQTIEKGVATVQLEGGCGGCGTHSIYDSIVETLTQFSEISAVSLQDPQGKTGEAGIPFCLEP